MRFLIDVGVGRKVEEYLLASGFDVKTVRNINHSMKDIQILELAEEEQRVIVTMDKDFGELVYHAGHKSYGVLLLRLNEMNGEQKMEVVKYILTNFSAEIPFNFCVYYRNRFRVRSK